MTDLNHSHIPTFELRNNTLVREVTRDPARKIAMEMGDLTRPDYVPQIKTKWFDNEYNVSIRAQEHPAAVVRVRENKVFYETPDYTVIQYEKSDAGDEGGHELEWELPAGSTLHVLPFTLRYKGDVQFYYQDALTDEEIKQGARRPDNVVGSYAVYIDQKNHHIGGNNYGCGKIGHIYRPKAWDEAGNETWCELSIPATGSAETNIECSVIIPPAWLAQAVGKVTVDPTFGYDSKGASSNYWTPYLTNTHFTTVEAGTATSMSVYLHDSIAVGPSNVVMGIYNSAKSKLVQTAESSIAQSFNDWKTIDLTESYELATDTLYWLSFQTEGNIYKFYDTGSARTNLYYVAYSATLPSTFTNSSTQNEIVSIYATYSNEPPTVTDPTPILEFTGTDPEDEDVTYEVQIDTANTFDSQSGSPLLTRLSASHAGFANTVNGGDTDPFTSDERMSFTVQSGDALDDGTYYWRVRAKDPLGSNTYGAWSSTRSFTVESGSPPSYNPSITRRRLLLTPH